MTAPRQPHRRLTVWSRHRCRPGPTSNLPPKRAPLSAGPRSDHGRSGGHTTHHRGEQPTSASNASELGTAVPAPVHCREEEPRRHLPRGRAGSRRCARAATRWGSAGRAVAAWVRGGSRHPCGRRVAFRSGSLGHLFVTSGTPYALEFGRSHGKDFSFEKKGNHFIISLDKIMLWSSNKRKVRFGSV
jgi:hypothetical protein